MYLSILLRPIETASILLLLHCSFPTTAFIMLWKPAVTVTALLGGAAQACESCEHPEQDVVLTRNVRRMQPEAQNATSKPKAPLEWGQLNFLHTTDTHGFLEGHLKDANYGADWGDFVSFAKDMRKKAKAYGVDLLLVDTGVSTAWIDGGRADICIDDEC